MKLRDLINTVIYSKHLNWVHLIAFLIIGLNLFFSIYKFENIYYLIEGDVGRDYLVANHILKFHEFPLIGPWNSVYQSLRNSPLYYYLLAFFLIPHNDILSLGYVNIFLQLISLLAIYYLAYSMFGKGAAISALLIFGFSSESLRHSLFVWQPYIVHVFSNISLLLLFLFYKHKRLLLLFLSVFLFVFSASLGFYVFPLIPIYFTVIFMILKRLQVQISIYFQVLFFGLTTFLLFYTPIIIFLIYNKSIEFVITESVYVNSVYQFSKNIFQNLLILVDTFFFIRNMSLGINHLVAGILLITIIFYFIFNKTKTTQKVYSACLLVFILSSILATGLLKTLVFYHYLTPVFGIFIIFISHVISQVFSQHRGLIILRIIFISLLIYVSSSELRVIKTFASRQENYHHLLQASEAIQSAVNQIKKVNNYKKMDFFQIQLYLDDWGKTYSDAIFWVPLEKNMQIKFTKIVDEGNNYQTINKNDYMFLVCQEYDSAEEEMKYCINKFQVENENNFNLQYKIYEQFPFTIYLLKR